MNKTYLRRLIERLYLLEIHTNIDTNEINDIEVEINRHTITTFTYDEQPIRAAAESGTLMRRLANQIYDIWVKKREECVMKRTLCHRDRYV